MDWTNYFCNAKSFHSKVLHFKSWIPSSNKITESITRLKKEEKGFHIGWRHSYNKSK